MPKISPTIVKMWQDVIRQAAKPVTERLHLLFTHAQAIARHELEEELGVSKLKALLEKHKAEIERIEEALGALGVPDSGNWKHQAARSRFQANVESRARDYLPEEVQVFEKNLDSAIAEVSLAGAPDEVRAFMESVKKQAESLSAGLPALEARLLQVMSQRKIEAEVA